MRLLYTFKVMSNSMFPAIKANNIVIVEKTSFDSIKINDIVAFRINNDYKIIHRLIEKNDVKGTTKGDNANLIDTISITPEILIGKAKYIIHDYIISNIYTGKKANLFQIENNNYYCDIDNISIYFFDYFTFCGIKENNYL